MNIGDLDPIVQCEILRLAHSYANKQRDYLDKSNRVARDESEYYYRRIKEATESLVSLYKQSSSN